MKTGRGPNLPANMTSDSVLVRQLLVINIKRLRPEIIERTKDEQLVIISGKCKSKDYLYLYLVGYKAS